MKRSISQSRVNVFQILNQSNHLLKLRGQPMIHWLPLFYDLKINALYALIIYYSLSIIH